MTLKELNEFVRACNIPEDTEIMLSGVMGEAYTPVRARESAVFKALNEHLTHDLTIERGDDVKKIVLIE
jgi:glycyl-tRNA synthetase beta subunit